VAGSAGPRIPPIVDLLIRAATVNSDALARTVCAQASVLFQPPLATVNLLDWQACDRTIDIGYRYATDKLAQLDQSIFHRPRCVAHIRMPSDRKGEAGT
jgi:NTE family protein